jgi:hypothetical protein
MSELPRLPRRFEFLHGATRKLVQLVWQRSYLIGISYEASVSKSLLAGKSLSAKPLPAGKSGSERTKQSILSRRRS